MVHTLLGVKSIAASVMLGFFVKKKMLDRKSVNLDTTVKKIHLLVSHVKQDMNVRTQQVYQFYDRFMYRLFPIYVIYTDDKILCPVFLIDSPFLVPVKCPSGTYSGPASLLCYACDAGYICQEGSSSSRPSQGK